jgi:hypothetical protein
MEKKWLAGCFFGCRTGLTPRSAMLHHPIEKSSFKSNVTTMLLTLAPFVPENFLPFRLELPVEGRIPEQITCIA